MAGIKRHRHDDFLAGRGAAHAARAQVILYVARALDRIRIGVAFEFREKLEHALADDIGEHGQAPAMRHADDAFLRAGGSGALEQLVDHGDHRFAAFERKPLVSLKSRVQKYLEALGRNDAFENPAPDRGFERPLVCRRLHALLQPPPLLGIVDVHVLDAQLAGVGQPQPVDQRAQSGNTEGSRVERAIQVPDGQAVRRRIEIRLRSPRVA